MRRKRRGLSLLLTLLVLLGATVAARGLLIRPDRQAAPYATAEPVPTTAPTPAPTAGPTAAPETPQPTPTPQAEPTRSYPLVRGYSEKTYRLVSDLVYTYAAKQDAGIAEQLKLLEELKAEDVAMEEQWREILEYWRYVNSNFTVQPGVIPEGLAEDDSLCVVVLGGLTATLARTIFEKKAPGIGTYGTLSADVTDAFGETHTVHLQRASPVPVALSIELTPLAGFDSSVTERIRTALTEYSNSLQIGQNIVVPSLYGLCYGADPAPSPTFSISLLSATAQGTSTSGVVSAAWNQRLMIPANMIQILVAG